MNPDENLMDRGRGLSWPGERRGGGGGFSDINLVDL